MPEISVVVPVYNSSSCLPELAARVEKVLQNNYELILVNDCSQDKSWQVIQDLANRYPAITGIHLRKNYGQDNAIMAGLRQSSGIYAVIMDDDLQHAPEDIPRLIEKCRQGCDVCYADFALKRQRYWKNLGSWINGKVAEVSSKKSRDLYLSPFKAVRAEVVEEICAYDGPFPYVDGLIMAATSNFVQITVSHHKRFAGKSNYSLRRSLSVWAKHVTGFSILPLRVASLVGLVSALAGMCLALYYVSYYFKHDALPGWTTLVCLQLIFCGLILMSLGVIGEYIGRIYLKVNKRPQYVIETIIRGGSK